MPPRSRRQLGLLLGVVDLLRWLAPASRRREWRRQWRADLTHSWMALDRRDADARERFDLAARVGGAARHAFWLRTHERTLDMITHDLRYGWRLMLRRPGFTAVAVLTLGLGIGANVTIYSWVEALLLRPIPGVDTSRFAAMTMTAPGRTDLSLSYPNFADLRAHRPAGVEDLIAYRVLPVNVRIGDEAQRAWVFLVSGNYFDVLGVKPALGRGFLPEEDRAPDAHPVVVLSDTYWRRHFDADPSIVGGTVTLNNRAFTVVGVAPPGFHGNAAGLAADAFVPVMMQTTVMPGNRLAQRGNGWLLAMVKLKPGATIAGTQPAFDVAARDLAAAYPDNAGRGLRLVPLWKAPGAATIMLPVLSVLMGVVGVVLLIACANVTNLLLARAAGRQRETAVRLALGASRGRLVQQLFTETMLLAVAGGAVGAVIAYWTSDLLRLFFPPTRLPLAVDAALSPRVLVFATLVTVGSAVVFGLVPALQGSASNLVPALKESSGAVSASPRRMRLRQVLVVAQVALSLVLLVSAGLFLKTLRNAQSLDPGFSTRKALLTAIDVLPAGYDAARGRVFYRDLQARVRELPGVEAASVAQSVPLDLGGGSDFGVTVDGYTPAPNEDMLAYYNRVGTDYLRTLGITLLEGRDFTERDTAQSPDVAIINETMARRYWNGRGALGGRIHAGPRTLEVVGIVRDGKYSSLTERPRPFMYLPVQQWYRPDLILHVKTAGDPLALVAPVQQVVRQLDPNLPIFDTQSMAEHLELALFIQRMAASLLGGFGVLALLLATIGLYGVIAAGVAQRAPEIGMRMALGASRRDIVGLVLRQGMTVTARGLIVGLAGSLAVTRLFKSQLVGVSATDASSLMVTSALLVAVAALATYLPARRAASIDPLSALRQE